MGPDGHAQTPIDLDALLARLLDSADPLDEATVEAWIEANPEHAQPLRSFVKTYCWFSELGAPLAGLKHLNDGAIPRRFGDFELLEEIGRGGMGVVFAARQLSLNRAVAIKLILAGPFATESMRRRLQHEAEAAAALTHPAAVTVHEIGEIDGQAYLAMEYVEGTNLAELIQRNSLAAVEAGDLVCQVAKAVDAAHKIGILHRDLKPSNILIDVAGRPRVTDFGLSMRLSVDSSLSHTGQIVGTPSYMSPEQIRSDRESLGPASDVYSLGAILYELLTGRPPFRGGNVIETAQQIERDEPLSVRRLASHVPRDLDTIVAKCLEKDPRRRYPSACLLADDLERYLAHRPIRARPASRAERLWKWAKRRPASAALVAVSIVAAPTVLVLLAVTANALRRSGEDRLALRQSNDRLAESFHESRLRNYATDMQRAYAAWDRADVGIVRRLLDRYRPSPGSTDVRGFEWHYLKRLTEAAERSYNGHQGSVYGVATSPDGRWIASAGEDGTVRLWPIDGAGKALILRGHIKDVNRVEFAPDRESVASASDDGTVAVWQIDSGQRLHCFDVGHPVSCLAISHDGKRIVASGVGGNIHLWNMHDGALVREFNVAEQVEDVAFTPNDEWLAVASHVRSRESRIKLWQVQDGRTRSLVEGQPGVITAIRFSPSGRVLMAAGEDGAINMWHLTSGELSSTLESHSDKIHSFAISPDGSGLVASGRDGTIRVFTLPEASVHPADSSDAGKSSGARDAESRESIVIKGHEGQVWSVAFAPDGQTLVSGGADGTVKCWNMKAKESVTRELQFNAQAAHFCDNGETLIAGDYEGAVCNWNHDLSLSTTIVEGMVGPIRNIASAGDTIVVAGSSSEVMVVDRKSGHSPITLGGHSATVHAAAISRDGRRVATGDIDGRLILWNAARREQVRAIEAHEDAVLWLAYSPDNRLVASAGHDRTIRIWDGESGEMLRVLRGHSRTVEVIQFSPDGTLLASGAHDGFARIWSTATGQELAAFPHSHSVTALAFSADGATLVTGTEGGGVVLHQPATGETIAELFRLDDKILAVAFSQDDECLTAISRLPDGNATLRAIEAL